MPEFRASCPKCSSQNVDINRLTGAYGIRQEEWEGKVFICGKCGLRIYGEPIKDELDRQHAEWSKGSRAKKKVLQAQRRAEAERAREEEAERKRRAEARRRTSLNQGPNCAWKDCENPSSSKSKYCSRSCSNQNARWRAKQRRKG